MQNIEPINKATVSLGELNQFLRIPQDSHDGSEIRDFRGIIDIKDLHFHDLRHEAISRLFEKGLSIPEVALISGHMDVRMLFRYTHLKAEDVLNKLNRPIAFILWGAQAQKKGSKIKKSKKTDLNLYYQLATSLCFF